MLPNTIAVFMSTVAKTSMATRSHSAKHGPRFFATYVSSVVPTCPAIGRRSG